VSRQGPGRDRWRVALRHAALALDFYVWASLAWLILLAQDIDTGRPGAAHLWGRGLYLVELACRSSLPLSAALALVHIARTLLLRRSERADRLLGAALALLLIWPCYRQAELLSSGSLLLESVFALPVRALVFSVLLGANLLLWQLHLVLVRAPGSHAAARARSLLPAQHGWRALLVVLAWFGPSALALFSLAHRLDKNLRTYMFLGEFLWPSVWLCAGSLLFGARRRLIERAHWPSVVAAASLALGLALGAYQRTSLRRARSELERRGGLIALTELAISVQRDVPWANLDISQPARFDCQPSSDATPDAAPPTPPRERRNVILISVDTLRKDALEMHTADGANATPALQSIAASSLTFERAVTTYPATLFALGSALSGQSPSEIMFAPQPFPNLFTLTRAIFPVPLVALPSTGWFKHAPVPELFTQSAQPEHFANAERATSWMIAHLQRERSARRRTFAWIHYFEPHSSRWTGTGHTAEVSARASYAGLVHEVDEQIGRLWQTLQTMGFLRDSLVIVFSDHGEALGELDYFGHHVYLNHFATDIPLLVHAPGLAAGRSQRQVILSDIAPTVLQWVGLPAPPGDAHSLFAQDSGKERYVMSEAFPVRGRALYEVARAPIRNVDALAERMRLLRTAAIDYQPKVALVSPQHRLIVNRVTGAEEFYDRGSDPNEERELSQDGVAEHARMRSALRELERRLSERIYCRVLEAGALH
jgi:arylsulfatase A-like enzyme